MSVTQDQGLSDRSILDRRTDSALAPEQHLLVKPGDIAYNTMRMWQGAFGLGIQEGMVSPAYVVIKPQSSRIDPVFASYWFKSPYMLHMFRSFSYGLTDDRLRLYYKDFSQIPVKLPALADQRRLGSSLANVDRLIRNIAEQLQSSRELRYSLIQSLSVRLCASPNANGDDIEVRGVVPNSTVKLSDVATLNPASLPEGTPPNKEFRYIDLSAVTQGKIDVPDRKLCFRDAPSRARRLFSKGDILVSTVRTNLHGFAYIDFDASDCVCSTGFAVVKPKNQGDSLYIYAMLYSAFVSRQIHSLLSGSSFPAIAATEIANIKIPFSANTSDRTLIGNAIRVAERQVLALEKLVGLYVSLREQLIQSATSPNMLVDGENG
jgi:type I restriction enzyme S subunit